MEANELSPFLESLGKMFARKRPAKQTRAARRLGACVAQVSIARIAVRSVTCFGFCV